MTICGKFTPDPLPDRHAVTPAAAAADAPPLVVALAYDGLCTFEFALVAEVFGLPRPEFPRPLYRFAAAAVEPGPLRAAGGLRVEVDGTLELLETAHTVVIPGWRDAAAPIPGHLQQALWGAWRRGARLVSICSGALVLARAGLLAGRRATTHWRYLDQLRAADRSIRVDRQSLYVDEGRLLTSAGSAAGLDLCLHLVRRDHGAAVANGVARRLVLPAHRPGGQAQFVPLPMGREHGPVAPLLARLQAELGHPWSVAEMARSAKVSERTLLRRFKETTGVSPKQWLLQQRLARARELLEGGAGSVEAVARAAGLGSAESLRHHFRRSFGVSPSAYRGAFRATAAGT